MLLPLLSVWIVNSSYGASESLVFRAQGTSSGCAGQNQHVQVYWNTPLILSVIALALASALLLPSFSPSPDSTSLSFSHLIACFLSFSLPVSHYLVHPLLLPPLPLFARLSLSTMSPLASSAASFLYFHLHYHSPHPHLTIPLLSPVRLEWRITEIPSWLSWIGYADVTDTTAPHKYTAYYLPRLQHTYKASRSSRQTSCLLKYMEFMQHVWCSL